MRSPQNRYGQCSKDSQKPVQSHETVISRTNTRHLAPQMHVISTEATQLYRVAQRKDPVFRLLPLPLE
jgi:hypothetical protein